MTETTHTNVTLFGETREIEFRAYGDRLISVGSVVVGRFPTGTKLHRSALVLNRRNARPNFPLRGETAAIFEGEEYVADKTLYTHNRNVGRITGWFEPETTPESVVAKW